MNQTDAKEAIKSYHVMQMRRLKRLTPMQLLDETLDYLEATGHGGHDIAWMIRDMKKRRITDTSLCGELITRCEKRLNPNEVGAPVAAIDKKIERLLFDLGKALIIRGV